MAVPHLGQIGQTGLVRYGGWVFDEWMPELQGARGRRVLREMQDNDPTVGAFLFALEMLIRQVGWNVVPHDDAPDNDERVDFIDDCLHDMIQPWEDTLSEILTFLPYGFSFHELVYKRRPDGRVGWHSWPMRGQETVLHWEFSNDGGQILELVQLGPPDYIEHRIPMEKALLFRTTTRRGNPEGRSILRNAYRPWYFKKHIETIEAIGIERDLAGLPMIGVPPDLLSTDATAEQAEMLAAFTQMVTHIRRDEQEGIVYPLAYDDNGNPLFKIELLSTGGSRQFDTDKIIGRYDQRILMTVLADFIVLGHESVGSNAMAVTKGDFFQAALGAWLQTVLSQVNDIAIPRLLRLNGMPDDVPPQLTAGDIERTDLVALGTYLWRIHQAGIQLDGDPSGGLARHLMNVADLPEPPDDLEPIVEPPPTPTNEDGREEPEDADADGISDDDESSNA